MHRLPRQAGTSAAPSDATTAAASTALTSAAATGTPQTSSLTSDATSTAVSSSSSTTPASTSTSAEPTTLSSSAETTSTSSPSSTRPSSSSTPDTTSPAQTPSVSSQSTSPTSSLDPSSTTPLPPTSSSPRAGTPTLVTSTYTTFVDGTPVITSTTIPSTIPDSSVTSSSSHRTAVIAGSAAGGTALIVLVLSLAFFVRRKRFKQLDFLDAITLRRRQARSRATLLDVEDPDVGVAAHGYSDYETPWDTATARGRSGTAFREDVWPPPHEGTGLMDPLANRDDPELDLGGIVDNVMGPPPTARHYSDQSVSSVHRGSVVESDRAHSRTVSNASNAVLLEAAGLGGTTSNPSVQPSPLTREESRSDSAGHYAGVAL